MKMRKLGQDNLSGYLVPNLILYLTVQVTFHPTSIPPSPRYFLSLPNFPCPIFPVTSAPRPPKTKTLPIPLFNIVFDEQKRMSIYA